MPWQPEGCSDREIPRSSAFSMIKMAPHINGDYSEDTRKLIKQKNPVDFRVPRKSKLQMD